MCAASSVWGNNLRLSVFGESHGPAVGVVLDGFPWGETVDMDALHLQMRRRAPGQDKTATPRKEADLPQFLSGIQDGFTTGAPICILIENTNTHSGDYSNLKRVPRPGHSDYPAFVKYGGFNDIRGGGHFSARITAGICAAGALCRQVLLRRGVRIAGHVLSIGDRQDACFPETQISPEEMERLASLYFPTLQPSAKTAMEEAIQKARTAGDSIGGVVECAVTGMPAGLGGPLFGGVESLLSAALFAIPAVKGVEFGAGFSVSRMRGSQNNDPFRCTSSGQVVSSTNHAGGILGGITDAMPILFRAAFKPTPSISLPQESVDLLTKENVPLEVRGRHDPCVVPRAVPVVESMAALCMLDLLLSASSLPPSSSEKR